ncbi:MAG: ATP-binding cassette domain-containing protein [Candidatus Uhrbacteria bacterium]
MSENRPTSIFEKTGEVTTEQKARFSRRVRDRAVEHLHQDFSDYDFVVKSPECQELERVFNEFLAAVFAKAGAREFFSPQEKSEQIEKIERGLAEIYQSSQAADKKRLETLETTGPNADREEFVTSQEFIDQLLDDKAEIEKDLDKDDLPEEVRNELKNELKRIKILLKTNLSAVLGGQVSGQAPNEDDLVDHRESVGRFLSKKPSRGWLETKRERLVEKVARSSELSLNNEKDFDSHETAEAMVDEYETVLITSKVVAGLAANYSDEEILAHLREVLPEATDKDFTAALRDGRARLAEGKKDPVSQLDVYLRILSLLFSKKETIGFTLGTLAIGAMAPLGTKFFGDFLHSFGIADLGFSALFFSAPPRLKAKLDAQFSFFLTSQKFGEGDLAGKLFASILRVSPEGLSKNSATFLRQEFAGTLEHFRQIAEVSVKDIGSDLTQTIFLLLAAVVRLGDPLLLIPVLTAVGVNLGISALADKQLGPADRAMRKANSDLIASADEALRILSTRGDQFTIPQGVKEKCAEAEKAYAKARGQFAGLDGASLAIIVLSNGLLGLRRGALDPAAISESVLYSLQAVGSLNRLVNDKSRLVELLRPVAELTRFVNEFSETGGEKPEKWEIELTDVKRRGLTVPQLKIQPGDFCVVVGESGAGKSTLLDILYGFGVERGSVEVDGQNWRQVDKKVYREGLLVANQFYALRSCSIKENIVGNLPFDQSVFNECLETFGLNTMLEKAAGKKQEKTGSSVKNPAEDLVIGQEGFSPSGGEAKRLAMATIDYRLQVDPAGVKVIVLDEPTSGLSPRGSQRFFERLAVWRKDFPDKTIIVSNHDDKMFEKLSPEVRILGLDSVSGTLVQDETLEQAKENSDAPFAQLFPI